MPKLVAATGSRGPFGLSPQSFSVMEPVTLHCEFLLQWSGIRDDGVGGPVKRRKNSYTAVLKEQLYNCY